MVLTYDDVVGGVVGRLGDGVEMLFVLGLDQLDDDGQGLHVGPDPVQVLLDGEERENVGVVDEVGILLVFLGHDHAGFRVLDGSPHQIFFNKGVS